MNTNSAENLALLEHLFLTLGDKTRLRLLGSIAAGPVTVSSLVDELGDSQPKISRHLAYMREHGYVSTRREGKCIYYGIKEPENDAAREILGTIIDVLTGRQVEFASPIFNDNVIDAVGTNGTQPLEDAATSDHDGMIESDTGSYFDDSQENYYGRETQQELEVFLL